jgi:hypothetical protein
MQQPEPLGLFLETSLFEWRYAVTRELAGPSDWVLIRNLVLEVG